jgi:hypothetical protein
MEIELNCHTFLKLRKNKYASRYIFFKISNTKKQHKWKEAIKLFNYGMDIPLENVLKSEASLVEVSENESPNQETDKYAFNYSMHIPFDSLSNS